MNSLQILALSKLIKEKQEKAARSELGPGMYPVDATFHVKGMLSVGTPTEAQQSNVKLCQEVVSILLTHEAKTVRNKALKALEEAKQRILAGISSECPPEVVGIVESLPKVQRSGSVSFSGNVLEIVEEDDNVAISA